MEDAEVQVKALYTIQISEAYRNLKINLNIPFLIPSYIPYISNFGQPKLKMFITINYKLNINTKLGIFVITNIHFNTLSLLI